MNFINGISIIGSGNVAWHLAIAFLNKKIPVNIVVSRNIQNARKLAEFIGTKYSDDLSELPKQSALILLCITDNEVEHVIKEIRHLTIPAAHTSASLSLEVFKDYRGNSGVFYPFQTFTKEVRLGKLEIPLCIETRDQVMKEMLYELAHKISNKVYDLNSEKRKILHIAGVFANNFTNYMFVHAYNILNSNNIAPDILKPLIEETFNKLSDGNPEQLQTGPAKRNVESIIHEHSGCLKNNKEQQELYNIISAHIMRHFNDKL